MKLAIMQPYFFPYLGYLSLIKHTEMFILFDSVQFIRHGWIERNRILKPNDGWQYIKVPLQKYSRDTLIKDIKINNTTKWGEKNLAQIQHYKKTAPFYLETIELLQSIFNNKYDDIVNLNMNALVAVLKYLQIDRPIKVYSKMNISIDKVKAPDEWALNICKALVNIDEYWNPIGGRNFFDRKKYSQANINLKFHTVNISKYKQKSNIFTPNLSIIDVMMFNSKEVINKMLDNYELI
jgi:hypothetical protein